MDDPVRSTPTIRDVAALAGVSITSVSHTLSTSRTVGQETAARVWRAVEELGYQPNRLARGLRLGHTGNIGLVLPDMSATLYTTLARSIHNEALSAGFHVQIRNTDDSLEQERDSVTNLVRERSVDGVILVPTGGDHAYLSDLARQRARLVVLHRRLPESPVPAVIADNEDSAYAATKHMLALGHSRVVALAGPGELGPNDERVSGYLRALLEHGVDEAQVMRCPALSERDRRAWAYEAVVSLLEKPGRPTAVMALSHYILVGASMALRDLDVACPEAMALMGFGNAWEAEALRPSASVVQQDTRGMALAAVGLVCQWIGQGSAPTEDVVVRNQFVIAESCGWRHSATPEARAYCAGACPANRRCSGSAYQECVPTSAGTELMAAGT